MLIKAKLHSNEAPTIIRLNPFLNGNALVRGIYEGRHHRPRFKSQNLRVNQSPPEMWHDEIKKIDTDWRRWLANRAVRIINSISQSMTLMANDYGIDHETRQNQTGYEAFHSAMISRFKQMRARCARKLLQWWERIEDKVIDELYTTH